VDPRAARFLSDEERAAGNVEVDCGHMSYRSFAEQLIRLATEQVSAPAPLEQATSRTLKRQCARSFGVSARNGKLVPETEVITTARPALTNSERNTSFF
jgi:hypothetical protein